MTKIRFWVEKRDYNNNYALFCQIDSTGGWNLWDWDRKPKEKEIEAAKGIAIRSMDVYHRYRNSTQIPFDLEVQDG